jgi:hypothetical protein
LLKIFSSLAIILLFLHASFCYSQTWFTEVAEPYNVLTPDLEATYSAAWADFDNDGDEDLLFTYSGWDFYFKLCENQYPDPYFEDVSMS